MRISDWSSDVCSSDLRSSAGTSARRRKKPKSECTATEGGAITASERALVSSTSLDIHSMRFGSGDSVPRLYGSLSPFNTRHTPRPGTTPEPTTAAMSTLAPELRAADGADSRGTSLED